MRRVPPAQVARTVQNDSRFIVASSVSRTQDRPAFLQVLLAAITEYGAPEALVSDGGSIFKAQRAMAIYAALSIEKERIARRQPWQSSIETNFNVQRRMADYHFSRATTRGQLLERHAAWVHDYNSQRHWAHLKRQDGRRSPAEVLDWVKGRAFSDESLARCFAPILSTRRVDQQGYVRFRNWRLYGERGLTDQPPLLELNPDDWRLAIELPRRQRGRRRRPTLMQATLFAPDEVAVTR